MSVGRLRTGELLALGGLAALIVSLFLDWFSPDADARCQVGQAPLSAEACATLRRLAPAPEISGGWGALGHPWLEFLGLFAIGLVIVLVLAQRAGPGRPTYGAVTSVVFVGTFGALVLVLTLIRVFLARPDALLPGFADSPPLKVATSLAAGGWVGLAGLVVAVVGLWIALADDRPDAPESRFDPPTPRPVPARPDAAPPVA